MMKQIENIDKLFAEGLKDLEITPSPLVKQQVQKKMFWINFFKKYGIYTFLFFLFVGIVGLFSFNNTSENLLEINPKKLDISNQTTTNNVVIDHKQIELRNNTNTKNPKTLAKENSYVSKNLSKTKQDKFNTSTPQLKKNTKAGTIKTKELQGGLDKLPKNNSTIQKEKNLSQSSIKQPTQKSNNEEIKSAFLAQSNSSIKNAANVKNNTSQELLQRTISASSKSNMQLKQTFSDRQVLNPMPTKECSKLLQKIVLPEIPNDTVGMDIYQNPIVLPSHRWSLSFYLAPNYSFINTQTLEAEYQNLAIDNQNSLSPRFSYSLGITAAYQFKQIALEGGISFAQYMQNFEAVEKKLTINNISYWENYQTQKWKVDSTAYINLDSIFQADTVLIYKKDSTAYFVTDSTLKNRNDSVWNTNKVLQQNIYRYIEIPLFVSYNFNRGAFWQPFVGVGLLSGVYLKTQTYYLSSDKLISTEELPFAKFSFWAGLNAGIRYRYSKDLSFYTAIHYRYQLNSLFDKPQYYQQKLNNLQWQWGISYRF